jgi:class 3 adenylate cyclase
MAAQADTIAAKKTVARRVRMKKSYTLRLAAIQDIIGANPMADQPKMERTWLCSVLFMDIAKYSSQSVELQMKWKQRFNGYLAEAIEDVPESERVILDTGDGAAVCFLGAPEAAMFAALQLCRSFTLDERDQPPGLRVRMGINLGPVKLVKDINGALNALGDGINAGQRVMSFAAGSRPPVARRIRNPSTKVPNRRPSRRHPLRRDPWFPPPATPKPRMTKARA